MVSRDNFVSLASYHSDATESAELTCSSETFRADEVGKLFHAYYSTQSERKPESGLIF